MSETDVIRNFIHALAQAVDLDQALEIVLVNLREVFEYDRAGLFILDENYHLILNRDSHTGKDRLLSLRKSDDPIITQIAEEKKPLIFKDIQLDNRFKDWEGMDSIRSWIGAPLIIRDKLIGFLSLGSLKKDIYGPSDGVMIQTFASQIVLLIEKAWLHEQFTRKTEELEGITALSIALGQAEGYEIILDALFKHIGVLFGAQRCLILFPDQSGQNLVVRYGTESNLIGASFSKATKTLWDVLLSGEPKILNKKNIYQQDSLQNYSSELLEGLETAVIVSLKSSDISKGILFIGFENMREFGLTEIGQFVFISEIAASSLERVILLEELENKINTRSNHLSVLFDINTYASKQLQLDNIIDKILSHAIGSMNTYASAVYLKNQSNNEFELEVYQSQNKMDFSLPKSIKPSSDTMELLFGGERPLVINPNEMSSFDFFPSNENIQILFNPIFSKSLPIGILICFNKTLRIYSENDFSLFNSLADQLGIFIEREQLISKAEAAAVLEERQRLARDLHDSITQMLYSQVLFAGAGKRVLNQNQVKLTEEYLNRLENQAQQALREMRLMVYELLPVDHLDHGLYQALKNRIEAVEQRSGFRTQLIGDQNINLGSKNNYELYQIAQEALNNTLKHSSARSVVIKLIRSNGQTIMEIEDDGCGFSYEGETSMKGGHGIKNMLERSKKLGGNLAIETSPGKGTKVIVKI
ncbi:MAG: GAF domain-containing protein [Anaerolineales bacterium]